MSATTTGSCVDFLVKSENSNDGHSQATTSTTTDVIARSSRNHRPEGVPQSRDSRDLGDEEKDKEEASAGWRMSRQLELMMKEILGIYLRNARYHADRCSKLAKDICEVIKDQAKRAVQSSSAERYRLVVHVVIGQDNVDSTVQLATRCLCNQNVDLCVSAIYRNKSLYAMSVVCAFHTEC